jgi:glycosyltransferase involved in cell wall biosynthesis
MRRKKGTEYVERAVSQLQAEGLNVELVLIEKVPFHEVKSLYASADIGIDQMLYGWHGKVSLELMAMGRPVICYLDEQLVSRYRPDLPIVNANPGNLVEKLRWLCQDEAARERISCEGIDYVRRYHDAERVMDQCLQLYAKCGAPVSD